MRKYPQDTLNVSRDVRSENRFEGKSFIFSHLETIQPPFQHVAFQQATNLCMKEKLLAAGVHFNEQFFFVFFKEVNLRHCF